MEQRNIFEILHREFIDEHNNDIEYSSGDSESDSASDSEEDQVSESSDNEEVGGDDPDLQALNEPDFVSSDGTEWQLLNPNLNAQPRQHNIMRRREGLTPRSQAANNSILDIFSMYLTEDIVQQIVRHTNQEAQRVLIINPGARWRPTDAIEMKAFIALLIYAGVSRSGRENNEDMWDAIHGKPMYKAMLSLHRFKDILRFIRFDDKRTRAQRRLVDKVAPIRDMFQLVVQRFKLYFVPSQNVTIDEQLVKFRGKCPFRQYMPNKPGKYGIKLWLCCDSATGYVMACDIYTGRPVDGPRQRNVGPNIALSLIRSFVRGHHVFCDRFFTSFILADQLLTINMTLTGTVQANRTFVPKYVTQKKEVGTTIRVHNGNKTLLSYQDKPQQKPVLILSTMYHNPNVIDGKPEAIQEYNQNKCGVDVTDMMCSAYSSRRKSRRWPLVLFCNLLDIMAINAYIIWRLRNPIQRTQRPRRKYLQDLALELSRPHIQRRQQIQQTPRFVKKAILLVLDENPQVLPPGLPQQRPKGRCHLCPRNADRKVAGRCNSCGSHVCPIHSRKVTTTTCTDCE